MLDDFGRKCDELRRLYVGDRSNILIGYSSYMLIKNEMGGDDFPKWEELELYEKKD